MGVCGWVGGCVWVCVCGCVCVGGCGWVCDYEHRYESKLARELEQRIRGFMEEKESKLAEIREFRDFIDSKLQMLRQVLGELATKEEYLETAYAAAIKETNTEYVFSSVLSPLTSTRASPAEAGRNETRKQAKEWLK